MLLITYITQIAVISTGLTEDQKRYRMMMDRIQNEGQRSSPPFGLSGLGQTQGSIPVLPPPPRVEPRSRAPK